jgi:hypothetical protein
MSSTTKKMQRESRPGTTSRRRTTLERTETGRAAPNVGGAQPNCGSSRSIPHDDRSLMVSTPSTHWWRHASRDRTHRSARDWQRYVVGKVLLSPQTERGSRRRRWWSRDHQDRGSSRRGARCRFDHRTWRVAQELSVRNHRLQPPISSLNSGMRLVNTKCVRDCVRCFFEP